MNTIIDLENLSVTKKGTKICAVSKLDIAVGERVAVLGQNGSGKTTLLRVLAGLETDFEGKCTVSARERVYVHQSPFLFRGPALSNVMYGLRAKRHSRGAANSTAMQWLKRFGVGDHARSDVTTLSGGERKRVALARAFAVEPAVLLLDEPFVDLDAAGIALICDAVADAEETTIVISSPVALPERLKVREVRMEETKTEP